MKKFAIIALCIVTLPAFAAETVLNPGVDQAWDDSYDAGWGDVASRTNPSSGGWDGGAYFQLGPGGNGSSVNAMVFPINASVTGNVDAYFMSSGGSSHWSELGMKLGTNSAQNFDDAAGTWVLVYKVDGFGNTNGSSVSWTNFPQSFNSGANTTVTVAVKAGASGGAKATLGLDDITIQDPLPVNDWMLY